MSNAYDTSGYERLLNLIPRSSCYALDIGCGTGSLGKILCEKGIVSDGITANEDECDSAKPYYRRVWCHDLENGLPETIGSYDVVIISHVLEHIADPKSLMEDLMELLSEDSCILCAVPNMLFLYNRLNLLRGYVKYQERGLMDYTHVRWYTLDSIQEMFSNYGFYPNLRKAHGHAPLGPIRKVLPRRIAKAIDEKMITMFPGLLAWEFQFRFVKG